MGEYPSIDSIAQEAYARAHPTHIRPTFIRGGNGVKVAVAAVNFAMWHADRRCLTANQREAILMT